GAAEAIAESSDVIGDAEIFDVYHSPFKYSDAVPGTIMSKLLDSLSSCFQAELDSTV
ncbi:hypothetical protein DFH09DRAFT_880081, partial [Mycena vulgaris]